MDLATLKEAFEAFTSAVDVPEYAAHAGQHGGLQLQIRHGFGRVVFRQGDRVLLVLGVTEGPPDDTSRWTELGELEAALRFATDAMWLEASADKHGRWTAGAPPKGFFITEG